VESLIDAATWWITNHLLHISAGGSTPNLPFPWGVTAPIEHSVVEPHKSICQMASKCIERFKQGARMWQTDRPRYGEMCRNSRNCLHCKSDSGWKFTKQKRNQTLKKTFRTSLIPLLRFELQLLLLLLLLLQPSTTTTIITEQVIDKRLVMWVQQWIVGQQSSTVNHFNP